MKPSQIILAIGCLTVFTFDALSAIASRKFNFNYARMAAVSFLIYALIGLFGIHYADQSTGVILAAVVGFFDATVGWKISMVLKANTGKLDNNPTTSRWISTAILVTLLAGVCGLAGSELLILMH